MISVRHLGFTLLLGLFLFGQTCVGQNPLQDLQKRVDENLPRGRFFKKLREDAQAREEKKDEEKRRREQERLEKERERQTRELQKRGQAGYGQPGPNQQYPTNPPANAANPGTFRQPPSAAAGQFAPGPQRGIPQHQPTLAAPNTRMPTPEFAAPRLPEYRQPETTNAGRPQQVPAGFGIVLVEQKDRLVVAEITPDSNAAQAGLRRGDVITQIGGVDISTLDEFDEITRLMQNGDQIEFEFARNGKTSKVSVSYGSPEQVGDELPASQVTESRSAGIDDNSNDFAPPRVATQRTNSILDSTSGSSRTTVGPPRGDANNSDSAELQALRRTVEEQRRTIERLENELKRLQNNSPPRDDDPPIG